MDEIEKIFGTLTDPRYQVDMTIIRELQAYARNFGAEISKLPGHRTNQHLCRIGDLMKEVQSTRSRLSEIRVGYRPLLRTLKRLKEAAGSLLHQHPDYSGIKPAPAKALAISTALAPLNERIDDALCVMEGADDIDTLLGNAHHTLRELTRVAYSCIDDDRNNA